MSAAAAAGAPAAWRFALDVVFCEDAHVGTGVGGAGVDDLLSRDRLGRPVVRWSHLKGLLVESLAERADALGLSDRNRADVMARLFGQEDLAGTGRGLVTGRSLRSSAPAGSATAKTLVVAATARRPGSRAPMDDSLRRIEYLAAGTVLTGEIRLRWSAETGEADLAWLRALIRRTHRLGGRRRRGAGRIQVKCTESRIEPILLSPEDPARPPDNQTTWLRLGLRALEPVCLAAVAQPGNEVPSHTHLPPAAVGGSLTRWAIVHGLVSLAAHWLDGRIVPGPGYPLPPDMDLVSNRLPDSIPIPLCLQSTKPAGQDGVLPWWAAGQPSRSLVDTMVRQDAREASAEKLKRPGADDYVVHAGDGTWRLFTCPLNLAMRNDAGTSQRHGAKQNLFSIEEIPEDTVFVVRLQVQKGVLPGLLQAFAALRDDRHWLTLGRAGAPAAVAFFRTDEPQDDASAPASDSRQASFDIYIESDLVLRHASGRFHTRLDHAAVVALLKAAGAAAAHIDEVRLDGSESEPVEIRGWNAATGQARFAAAGIRRGSVAKLSFGSNEVAAAACRAALASIGPGGLGERAAEGHGRIRIGYPSAVSALPVTGGDVIADGIGREQPLRRALELMALQGHPVGFSVARWQGLREAAADPARVKAWCVRAGRLGDDGGPSAAWAGVLQRETAATLRELAVLGVREARKAARRNG